MGIENWHLNHDLSNPAWKIIEKTRNWAVNLGLHPNTIKPYTTLAETISKTALAGVNPVLPYQEEYLTPFEIQTIATGTINQISRLAIIDIDGPIVDNLWTIIKNFHCPKPTPQSLRYCLEQNRPFWTSLLPLGRIAQRVNHLVLWTSRFSPSEKNLFWQHLKPVFGNLGSLDAFPFLSQEKIAKIESTLQGKIKVLAGKIKIFDSDGIVEVIEKIQQFEDPYVVFIGSSVFDTNRFKKTITFLRKAELPFDRVVFCNNGHLLL